MPVNNLSTPPGWQRLRCHGGQMFRCIGHPLMVKKDGGNAWRIWDLAGEIRTPREQDYPRWIDAVKAADERLKPRKESNHG